MQSIFIEQAISLQKNNVVTKHLKAALAEIVGDKDSEYDQVEIESINELIEDDAADTVPEWDGKNYRQ